MPARLRLHADRSDALQERRTAEIFQCEPGQSSKRKASTFRNGTRRAKVRTAATHRQVKPFEKPQGKPKRSAAGYVAANRPRDVIEGGDMAVSPKNDRSQQGNRSIVGTGLYDLWNQSALWNI